ncbi:hypothetical protein PVBG_05916 [Plasmodium vivax Brazil I]|uniref:PIR Superfamily Protein n=1 Tax=Plasmodium vivax (strain Brazil I) TaxID=1033975 RepID=A0A0J9T203_PLAV1|nr:hypothetical protein PVBG_05916 [Plasmodium vivax Brazil I]
MVKKDEAEYEKIIPHFYQIIQNKLKGGKFDTINECQHYSYDTKIADIIQKKSIYDYMNNYRSLITMNNIPNSQCKEPHLKYIAEVTSTYNKIYPTWGRNYEQCPDIYKKFMNKDPVTLIYILGWQEEPILRELIKVIKVARGDTVTLRVEGLNQSHEEDPEAGMMTTQLDHNADRDIMPEGSDNQPRREVIAAKDFQTAPVNEDMQGLTDNPGSPNITKTIIIPSLTTVFTFFTMYKVIIINKKRINYIHIYTYNNVLT